MQANPKMPSSKLSTSNPFLVITFALLLHTVVGADPLMHMCSSSKNFTDGSPYEYELKAAINVLNIVTPRSGFGEISINSVHGLSLCRGDVSASNCRSCVKRATSEILRRCPYNTGGIIWYDECMFKYADYDFFGKIDNTSRFALLNVQNVSDPAIFNQKTKSLLSRLANETCSSSKLFARGELELGESKKLYGMAQCTRDLSTADCKNCLHDAINELPSCCDGKEGGRVVGGSCNIRYEIYPFLRV